MTKNKWLRPVYQCAKCTLKYQTQPANCQCGFTQFVIRQVYNLEAILEFDAVINIIVGLRRIGKTYACAEYCINRYLQHQEQFVWIRRFKTETAKGLDVFIKLGYLVDKKGVYWKEEIPQTKGKPKVIKHYLGYIVTISTASRVRGAEFDRVFTLIWDEYADEILYGGGLPELWLLQSLMVTIFNEKQGVKSFILSNNANRFLELYQLIQVHWDQEWTYNPKMKAVCHIIQDEIENNWDGDIKGFIQSGGYYDYAFKNKPVDDDDELIESYKLEFSERIFCCKLNSYPYNLRLVRYNQEYYAVDICSNCCHDIVVLDWYNSIKINQEIDNNSQSLLYDLYYQNQLLYTTTTIKDEIFKYVLNLT